MPPPILSFRIFTLYVTYEFKGQKVSSKLHLVDLAGSEAYEGVRCQLLDLFYLG
jgi:hypothetical protein